MLLGKIFIFEFATIDGFATAAIASSEIATLSHEARNDSVELGSLEVKRPTLCTHTLLASAETTEVLSSFWSICIIKSDDQSLSRSSD